MRYDDMGQPVKPEAPHPDCGSSHHVWYGEALAEWETQQERGDMSARDDLFQVEYERFFTSAENFRRYLSEEFQPRNEGEGMDRYFLIELCDQVLDKRVNRVSN